MNIYEKMSKVTQKIKTIPKNLVVGTGKNQYKAVAEKDILNAVKDAETEYGIFSYPVESKIVESLRFTTKNDYGEKENCFVRVERTYRFVNIEKPDEYVEVKAYGDGVDTLDKAPGKAITYADKYALMKAYKIETGTDLDEVASNNLDGHDIFSIKRRVEQLLTNKIQGGAELRDILAQVGINEKQFNTVMSYFEQINKLETKIKKL